MNTQFVSICLQSIPELLDVTLASVTLYHPSVFVIDSAGLYLWEHIFDADLVPKLNGVWSYGEQKVDEILFRLGSRHCIA